MTKLLSLLVAVLLAGNMPFSVPADNVNKENTKHVVKYVTLDKTADTDAEEDTHDVYELEYDEKGRVIKVDSKAYSGFEKYLYPDMVYSVLSPGIDTYQYNSSDNISRITRTDEDGKVRFIIDYVYKDGKPIRETYNNGTKEIVSTYFYTEEGTLDYVERDEGIRISTLKFRFNDDGALKYMRLKERFNISDLDYVSEVHYQADGKIQLLQMMSGNTIDESTGINFTYYENGDLYQVKYNQGYFKTDYCFTYEYEDIAVTD